MLYYKFVRLVSSDWLNWRVGVSNAEDWDWVVLLTLSDNNLLE